MYEIGKYNTSHVHTYETEKLAEVGLTNYLTHTKSQGLTNIVHFENNLHNAMVPHGISF